MLLRNAIRCSACLETIESRSRHDFHTCRCGSVSVDGGHDYAKRAFRPGATWDELAIEDDDAHVSAWLLAKLRRDAELAREKSWARSLRVTFAGGRTAGG